jgi:hypothetical protein
LPPGEEQRLAGAPIDDVLAELSGYRDDGARPTSYEWVLGNVRRRVERWPALRRAVLPVAKLLGLADR